MVPTYNRPLSLERCLQALCAIEYADAAFEAVVVDDGGDEPLDELIARFSDRLDVRCLRQDNRGPASARNAGIAIARGRYIALTDDDCAPAPDWLTKLKVCFDHKPQSAVAGRAENGLIENPYSTASQLLIDYLMSYYNRDDSTQNFGTSNNLAFPRDKLHEIGGFDESFPLSAAEDRELVDRWVAAGNVFLYTPEAVVIHFHRMNLKGYSRQHLHYGRGAHRYHLIHASRARAPVKREPMSFYVDMIKYSFKHGNGLFNSIHIALLIAWSQVCNAAGYFFEKRAAS